MRRSVKLAALTSAAALLAIGASMTSFAAARGWTQEGGEWVWLDSYGEKVTATFKPSGNNYYYLNDDGYLGCDELVEYEDNYYYVDETGAMLRNTWKEVENTDDDDGFEDTVWYYFQSSGKAYKSTKKAINGQTYIFNEDGKMLFGWINDKDGSDYEMADMDDDDSTEWRNAAYYAGEANDGAVVTSAWRQIRVHDEDPALRDDDEDDYDYWFYFGSNGKKYAARSVEELEKGYVEKTISGKKYAFTEYGNMAYEWVDEASAAEDGVKYFSSAEDGARKTKAWFKVVPSSTIDSEDCEDGDNEAHWFYAISTGKLAYNEVRTINGKKYLFNENGELLAGLRYIEFIDEVDPDDSNKTKTVATDISGDLTKDDRTEADLDIYTAVDTTYTDDGSKDGLYYFAKPIDDDAAMKTGSCSITVDGDSYSFKFKTDGTNKGKGINGPDGNYYYVNGRRITADSDQKFELYAATTLNNKITALYGDAKTADDVVSETAVDEGCDGWAVVSTSGTLVKSGTKKDGDDYKIKVSNYLVEKITDSDDNYWIIDDGVVSGPHYAD